MRAVSSGIARPERCLHGVLLSDLCVECAELEDLLDAVT